MNKNNQSISQRTRVLLCFLLIFSSSTSFASAPVESGAISWATSSNIPIATLSKTVAAHWYRLHVGISGNPKIVVRVDDTESPSVVAGGGGVLIFGKSIEVRQVSNNLSTTGNFEVLSTQSLSGTKVEFTAAPALNGSLTLVANLDTPRDFSISLYPADSKCASVSAIVFVDGKPIVNSKNQPVTYLPQGGVIATGKTVQIQISGDCGKANEVLQMGAFELL